MYAEWAYLEKIENYFFKCYHLIQDEYKCRSDK